MRPATDKEISCRITRTLLMYVEENNHGSLGSLLDGLELDQQYLMDTNNWVSHDLLQVLYGRMIHILGEKSAVYNMALASERFQSLGLLDRIVRLIGTPKLIYGQAPKYNKLFKLNGDVFIHELRNSWVLLEDRYHKSVQKTRHDCDYTRGVLAGIPTMFGMPLAHVEEIECQVRSEVYGERVWPDHPTYGGQGCLYRVHWKGFKSGALRKRFFARRSMYERAIEDLQEANQRIQEKYDEARQLASNLEKANAALTASKRELEASERRYRLLAENASDVIWTLNLETMRFDYVSPSILRVRGFTPDEAMEMSLEETLSLPSLESALKVMAEELERDGKEGVDPNRSRTLEVQQSCKDGSFVWAEATMTFIRNQEGHPVWVLGATRDINARKLAEDALRQSEERLRMLGDNLPEGAIYRYIQDTEGHTHFEYISAGIEALTGVTPAEIVRDAEALHSTILPEDRVRLGEAEVESRRTLSRFELEVRQRHRITGEMRWALLRSVPRLMPDGSTFWDGVHFDITERKRMEEALRRSRDELEQRVQERTAELAETNVALFESERKFRLIAETIEDVFWINPHGAEKMTYVSPSYEKIWGRPPDELYRDAKGFLDTIHPEDLPVVLSAREKHALGKSAEVEYRIVRPDGSIRWISDRGYPVCDAEGKVQMMVGSAVDITARKEAEERLRRHAIALEQVNRDLADFNYIAAHDLQEPLRLLVTHGDRLASKCKECADPEGRYFINRIQSSARRASNLIRDIHKYSMVSSRKEPFRQTDLNSLVRGILSDLDELVKQTGAAVEVGDLPSLEVDPTQIGDVFRNLLSNAFKFKRDDKLRIRIYGEAIDDGKQYRIFVEDNGIGFDEIYLDKIFTPFQRLHRRSQFEGSGIGLALCRKVLERHGGSITAKSKPNVGSTFIVTLPVSQVEGRFGR